MVIIESTAFAVANDNVNNEKIANTNENVLEDYGVMDSFIASDLLLQSLESKEVKGQQENPGPPARTIQVIQRFDDTTHVGPGQQSSDVADCHTGELAIGGGYEIQPYNSPTRVYQNEAGISNSGWLISVFNPGPDDSFFRAFAECVSLVSK